MLEKGIEVLADNINYNCANIALLFKKRNILVTVFTILFIINNSCKKQITENNPKIIKYSYTIKNL